MEHPMRKWFFLFVGLSLFLGLWYLMTPENIYFRTMTPMTRISAVFASRQKNIEEICRKADNQTRLTTKDILRGTKNGNGSLTSFQMSHMLIDHKHKLLYCSVPKTGSTMWKRIMILLREKDQLNFTDPLEIPRTAGHLKIK